MTKKPDPHRPLTPSQAAARLSIAREDLPELNRSWTRGDVLRLRAERPEWLTAARQQHAARGAAAAREKTEHLDALLDEGGYTRPDNGREDLVPYADQACMYLVGQGVSMADAEQAAARRWPSTQEENPYAL